MIRALFGRKFQADFFLPSFLLGFEGYAIFHLLPEFLEELKDSAAIDLAIFASLVVLVFSQLELGRRLSRIPPGVAMRDMIFGQSASFAFFALAPDSIWLIGGLLAWVVFSSGLLIANGRWTLLAAERAERVRDAISLLVGISVGLASARVFPYLDWPAEALTITGVLLALVVSIRIHFFAGALAGYSSSDTLWFMRDLRRDGVALAMLAQSAAAGLMIGFLFFGGVQIGPIIFGVLGATAILAIPSKKSGPEVESLIGQMVAGAALIIDALFWSGLTLGPFLLALAAALTMAGIRIGAWAPRFMIPAAERIGLHNIAVAIGVAAAGGIIFRHDSPLVMLGGTGALLIGAALLVGAMGRPPEKRDAGDQPNAT